MSGILPFFVNTLSGLLGRTPVPHEIRPYDSAETLGFASEKLGNGMCPECDQFASFESVHLDAACHSTELCRACGAKWRFNVQGRLLNFAGYDVMRRQKYLEDLEAETNRRTALLAADNYAKYAA